MARVNLMSQAEYAKHRGCSAVAVHKAIKAGRISLIDGKIDPAVADIQWAQNTRPRPGSRPAQAAAVSETASVASGAPARSGDDPDYWESRAKREAAEAQIAQLKLAEMQGALIDSSRARGAVSSAFRQLRDTLHPLGRKLAQTVATMDDAREIELAYQRALTETLDIFATRVLPELLHRMGAVAGEEGTA